MGRGVSGCATRDGFHRDPDGACRWRRQHGRGRGPVPFQHCQQGDLVHRRDKFKAEPILVDKLMDKVAEGKIELKTFHTLDEVLGDATGVTGIRVKQRVDTGATEDIELNGCFIAIGHAPNTDISRATADWLVATWSPKAGLQGFATQTSVPGVLRRATWPTTSTARPSPVRGTGCMAALDAQRFRNSRA